jgi:hypothetical protein
MMPTVPDGIIIKCHLVLYKMLTDLGTYFRIFSISAYF